MVQTQKHVFWVALLLAIFVFSAGILLGFMLENWRTEEIDLLAGQSEIDLLDIRLQNEIYSRGNFSCEVAVKESINLADKIYEESKILDRYEEASRLTESLVIQHKKYDVLRAMLLENSIQIRKKCKNSFDSFLYLYQYNNPSIETKAKQAVFSNLLSELKSKYGNSIILIPMAADNNLSSLNLIISSYNISVKELPVILINEKTKITEVENIQELEKYIS